MPSHVSFEPAPFRIRQGQEADCGVLLELIRELAVYEKLEHEVSATESELRRRLFGANPCAEFLSAETAEGIAGFALFFQTFSTFRARPGLYLEDLFVRPNARGRGIGTELFRSVKREAAQRGCARLEFSVLDWNEPARRFYRRLGAVRLEDWTVHRLDPNSGADGASPACG